MRATSHRVCLQHKQVLVKMCQDLGWLVNMDKSELEPKEVFNFMGYQFNLESGRVRPTPDRWQSLPGENTEACIPTDLFGLGVHVLDRPFNSHRKTGSRRPTTHEAHSVASQKQMENTGILRKSDSSTQVSASALTMVADRRQCSHRSTITPNTTCYADLYRHIKRSVGRSLKRVHCQRNLVPTRKQTAYKLPGTKGSVSSSKRVPRLMLGQNGSNSNRQHHGSVLHEQGRGHEVGPIVCPTLENLDLVYQETSDSKGPTLPRPFKCSSRQAIQIRPDHPNRMVPPSRGVPDLVQQVATASNRSLCHEIQQQVAPVCIPSSGPHDHCSGCTQPAMGGSGRIRLPTDSHIG